MLRLLSLLSVLCILVPVVHAQIVVQGTVTDAVTGQAMPAASLQVEGTYRGTITNAEGAYEIRLDSLPATLLVRFIGYQTARRNIVVGTSTRQDIALQPVTYELDELVVTDEDPAVRIMREVIRRKRQWREALETYRAEAYNRFTLANDTGIVSIIETLTDAYWDEERGMKEIVKGRRQTSNLDLPAALPAALFVANLYDDNIDVAGYQLVGVTHPRALSQYTFRLEGTRRLDDRIVYDISVTPKNRLKSGFIGRVAVLDEAYALLDVELRPGKAFLFPSPIDRFEVTYRQQYSNFGRDFWLPVDFRADIALTLDLGGLLIFPPFKIKQVSRFTSYDVNVLLPDTLYASKELVHVDSTAVQADTLMARGGTAVPLSATEQQAYDSIDSTMTLDRAFEPQGLLARFVNMSGSSEDSGMSVGVSSGEGSKLPLGFDTEPDLWFNRVDALHAALKGEVSVAEALILSGAVGYSTGLEDGNQWRYEAGAQLDIGPQRQAFLEGGYTARTRLRYDSEHYGLLTNSVHMLTGGGDYFDYYRSEGFHAGAGYLIDAFDTQLSVRYTDADHTALSRTTSYDFFGDDEPQRLNPPVDPGRMRTLKATLALGEVYARLPVFPQRHLSLSVENGSLDHDLAGALRFTRFTGVATWRFNTFFQRRLIPNALDLEIVAGTTAGELPAQRFGIVEAGLGPYHPFGALKTLSGRPYDGDQHLGLFWEHNFRTVPFEILGLRGLAKKGYSIIVSGGHGRTWLDEERRAALPFIPRVPDAFHHEVSISLSGLLQILRVDLAARLDEPGFAVGVSAARIF